MIRGVKKRKMRSNRKPNVLTDVPEIAHEVSEGLYHSLTRHAAASLISLSVVIHNKLALMNTTRERNKTIYGRWINRLIFEDAGHVDLNGVELSALMEFTGETADISVAYSSKQLYAVPYSEVEMMYNKLEVIIQSKDGGEDRGEVE